MSKLWDERYSDPEYAYGKEPNKYFKQIIDKLAPGKLLLPGEGEGRNAVYAAKLGWEVTAIDQSKEGMNKALKLASDNNVKINYIVHLINKFKFPENEYDTAALIFVHFPSGIRQTLHHAILKSLKPGGILIIEAFSKKQVEQDTGGPKETDRLYSLKEMKDDFKTMKILEASEKRLPVYEGKYHTGIADVIRIHAIK